MTWLIKQIIVNIELFSDKSIADKRISEPTLLVGILSSPDHSKERQSLRDTWLQINPGQFQYRFLIGETCKIYPQERTSQYNCEHLNISIPTCKSNTPNYCQNKSIKSAQCDNKISMPIGQPVFHKFVQFMKIIKISPRTY